jgi:steroid 5-alpha reductase family enzyme
MAGDDTVMSFIALGAMIVLVPLALTRLNLKSSWKDSVRLALFGTWVAAVIISVVQAFYIEFHEDIFGSTLAANDAVFAEFQPMFGIFLLVALSLLLLAVDYYQDTGWERRLTGWLAGIGLFIATVGGTLWAFGDPTTGALFYWIHVLGVFVIGISALAAAGAIYKTRIFRISHSELQ